jgi:hypothetical protein
MSVRILTGDCRDVLAGSWGAQSRGEEYPGGLEGTSPMHARKISAHPLGMTGTGSTKRTPGLKPKDLIGMPWRLAFALQADGWWLRQDIIWSKPNPMPESVTDRCTKAHEYLFLLTKSERYFYDAEAIKERRASDEDATTFRGGCYVGGELDNAVIGKRQVVGNRKIKMPDGWDTGQGGHGSYHRQGREKGRIREVPPRHARYESSDRSSLNDVGRGELRNKRSVWEIATSPFPDAHFATFPPALIEPCILAGCPAGGTVLDPFGGSGTTGMVADRMGRDAVLIELNPEYVAMAQCRIHNDSPLFAKVSSE